MIVFGSKFDIFFGNFLFFNFYRRAADTRFKKRENQGLIDNL